MQNSNFTAMDGSAKGMGTATRKVKPQKKQLKGPAVKETALKIFVNDEYKPGMGK
jgi:hypothetical protein